MEESSMTELTIILLELIKIPSWKDWELESGSNGSSLKIKYTLLNFIPLLVKNRQRDSFFVNEIAVLFCTPYYCIYSMIFAPNSHEKAFRVDLYTLELKHAEIGYKTLVECLYMLLKLSTFYSYPMSWQNKGYVLLEQRLCPDRPIPIFSQNT